MHCDKFWRLSKTCHFSNVKCFFKPFFAQKNSNVLLKTFFTPFLEFNFWPKLRILQRLYPIHCGQFWWSSKSCHFLNIRCFLKPFFAQNNSSVLLESFFSRFKEFQFLTQTYLFARAMAHALWPILAIFENLSFFEY